MVSAASVQSKEARNLVIYPYYKALKLGVFFMNFICHYVERMFLNDFRISTSRQRSGKGAIRKRFPLQTPRWEKTKLTIRYLYHEKNRKPNEQLFSQ